MQLKETSFLIKEDIERNPVQRKERADAPISKDMTSRSLFNLVLKILGIYFITNILTGLSQSLSVLVYFNEYATRKEAIYNLAFTTAPLAVSLLFSWLLIFRTNRVINFLKLDNPFGDHTLQLRIHRSVVLSIAVIVTGGITLVNEFPELFRQGFYYLQERKIYTRMAHPDMSYFLVAMLKVAIGLSLVLFSRPIVNFIEAKRKTKEAWYWPARIPFARRTKKKAGNNI